MSSVRALYGGLLRTELQAAAAYRSQLVLGALAWVVPVAFMALWRSAAGGGSVAGISGPQFTTYYAVLLLTTSMQISRELSFQVSPLVHSGQLSALLLRPVHPLHGLVARALAGQTYRLAPLLVVVPALVLLLGGTVSGSVDQWLLAAGVGILGTACGAYLGALMGSLALWLTESIGVSGLLFGFEWLVGGVVAPIALLPGVFPELLRHQPLWFAIGAPAELVSGVSTGSMWLLVEAALWLVGLHLLLRLVWRRGLRRYEAVGT